MKSDTPAFKRNDKKKCLKETEHRSFGEGGGGRGEGGEGRAMNLADYFLPFTPTAFKVVL